eukprot:m.70959 g.70959  ORF g.70959 m.70959 type:complete len:509 (-) comp11687_c0_seq1:105-1631(-)
MSRRVGQMTLFEESSELLGLGLKKGVLFHEINAGQPCFKCGDACPGFELHFWRKCCQHCKCSPFSHQQTEQKAQHKGRSVGRLSLEKTRPFAMLMARTSFLMGSKPKLPPSIAPKPNKVFEGEVTSRRGMPPPIPPKQRSFDQGTVDNHSSSTYQEEVTSGTKQFSEMSMTSNVQTGGPSNEAYTFVSLKAKPGAPQQQQSHHHEISTSHQSQQFAEMSVQGGTHVVQGEQPPMLPPKSSNTSQPSSSTFHSEEETINHVVTKLGELEVPSLSPELEFVWLPDGLDTEDAVEFFAAPYPLQQVPVHNTDGERHFLISLEEQLPSHDLNVQQCHDLSPEEIDEFDAFLELKSENHEIGQVSRVKVASPCYHCKNKLVAGRLQVTVEGAPGIRYHPSCFKCDDCEKLLAGLNVFLHDDLLLCERHFADKYKPRCKACDESILEEDVLEAEGASWHIKHFCCFKCDKPVQEDPYIPISGQPHCVPCFENKTARHREQYSVRRKTLSQTKKK